MAIPAAAPPRPTVRERCGRRAWLAIPPIRSDRSAPALARNQPGTPLPVRPARSSMAPTRASRYPIDRSNSDAVGLSSGSEPHTVLAALGATRKDTPDASLMAPAATAIPFLLLVSDMGAVCPMAHRPCGYFTLKPAPPATSRPTR